MKNVKLFEEFLNENIRKQLPEFLEKIAAAEKEFPSKNKRSELQKLAKKTSGSETIDQDTKFTYSPDGQVFVVYQYKNQEKVDDANWKGEGDVDKAKEELVLSPKPFGVYAETGRPGWRVYADGKKDKIGKYGETKY
tara:strand:- start:66 stop:476 length:411 start_codon:yes stop_codon:yes gene_type:complete